MPKINTAPISKRFQSFKGWYLRLQRPQKVIFTTVIAVFFAVSIWKIVEAATSSGVISNSSTTLATQASTMRHLVRTSEGTLHAFVQQGTQTSTCNSVAGRAGLVWEYSTDSGATWTCGEQLSSDTTNLMYASTTVDASDNIYVVYSTASTTANSSYDVIYRKLSKGSGSTWTVGGAQVVLDASGSTGYSYATLEVQGSTRLWVSARYYNGSTYQVTTYYSDSLDTAPEWTVSQDSLNTAGNSSSYHIPAMVRFGNNIGVIYNAQLPSAQVRWRVRNDSDPLTSWSGENLVTATVPTTATFSAISDANGNVYFAQNNGTNVYFNYWNGAVWSQQATVSTVAASNAFVSLTSDGSNVWVFYGDTTNISGSLSGSRRLSYKKGTLPYSTTEFDTNSTSFVTQHNTFDKYWSYFSAAYTNDTTDASSTTSADTQMLRSVGDIVYYGKLQKFDAISWDVSTNSVGGAVTWEYWNGSSWSSLSFTVVSPSAATPFTADGWAAFTDPADWATTTVNAEGTPYYYIRARVTTLLTTAPVGVQFNTVPLINWANVLPAPVSNDIYGVWTENASAPIRTRSGSASVTTATPNTATNDDIEPNIIGYSSLTTATHPSTARPFIRTSDGTYHAFVQSGSVAACGSQTVNNNMGLNWVYSTDSGSNWTCGGQLSNNLTVAMYASATTDSSDNIYVTYSAAANGANAAYDTFYQKLTKGAGATWTIETAQTALDSTASNSYTYSVIQSEGSTRLWLATRYFDGVNYQVSVYYSNGFGANPTWTVSRSSLNTASSGTGDHLPVIVRFSTKIGIIYPSSAGTTRWKFRSDADTDLTDWSNEMIVSNENVDSPTFTAVTDGSDNVYYASNAGTSIFFSYWNGSVWTATTTVTATAASSAFVSLAADSSNVWIYYSETTNLSAGLQGPRKLVYRKGVAPYIAGNFDASSTPVVSQQNTFDKYWSFVSSVFTNDTTDSASTTNADTQLFTAAGDIAYFGKTSKFDSVYWDLSTLGVGGQVVWEYYNGSAWVAITDFLDVSTPSFTNDGHISFNPATDWATVAVNGEGTPYYYVRARVTTTFSVAPVGVQLTALPLVSWMDVLPNPISNTIYGMFTDGQVSPTRVRFTSNSVTATTPNTTTNSDAFGTAGYSSTTVASQPSTMQHIVRTSEGTIHTFFQGGTSFGCGGSSSSGNNNGLVWTYSTDSGDTYQCGGLLSNDTTNLMYASAVADTNDNIYVVYSVAANGASSSYSTYYRKLTKGSGSTWTLGSAQNVLDASSGGISYTYSVLTVQGTTRLWLATRYYDGANYMVSAYYSDGLSSTPNWTLSQESLGTVSGSSTDFYPSIVRFGNRIGVVYSAQFPVASQRWRFRDDSAGLTSWSSEMQVSSENMSNPTYVAIADSKGYVYHASNNGTNIFFSYWNGVVWSSPTTVSTTAANTQFVSLSSDGQNIWVIYGDTANLAAGLAGTRNLVYKKGIPPYSATEFDSTATPVFSQHGTFTKYWSYVSTVFLNDTTDAANTTANDTQMVSAAGDIAYFGKSSKFDSVVWDLQTAGTVGVITWEYYDGASWAPITDFYGYSAPSFTADGYISFSPPSNWATVAVNGEGTPYYYIRARVSTSFSVAPVGIQFTSTPLINWANFLPSPVSNNIYGTWTENTAIPIRVRQSALAVTAATPNIAASTDLLPLPNSAAFYSSQTASTQVSTQRHLVKTSDGTLHAFINAGTATACGGNNNTNNLGGLIWIYSTDAGVNWTCGGQLWSDTSINLYASATVDTSDNIYVVYSQAVAGAGATLDTYYRKFTKGSGATWTMEAQQIALDSTATDSYTYSTIEVENTDRLWIATRYFNNTNYMVSVYYSNGLSAAPVWTVSQANLNTVGSTNTLHIPTMVRFGTNIGVIYNAQLPAANTRWRYRADSDGLTSWNTEALVSTTSLTTPTFSAVGDTSGNVYLAMNASTSVFFTYWNGSVWSGNATVSSAAANNAFVSTSLVNSDVYVYYGETTGLSSGLLGSRKVVYKKGVSPYATGNFDASSTSMVSHHGTFNTYWSYVASAFTNDATDAGDTDTADTQILTSVDDIVYLGKSTKFDSVVWDVSTAGIAGQVIWEYYNGSAWVAINSFLGVTAPSFTADGYIHFLAPSDWSATAVNGEGSSYYYVRARAVKTFTTSPVGVQFSTIPQINWAGAIANTNNLYYAWTEGSAAPMRVRFSAYVFNVAPNEPISLGPTNYVNGSAGSDNTPTLTFTSTDTNLGDTSSFRIQIDDSSDFSSPVVDYTSAQETNGVRSFTVGQAAGSGSYTVGTNGQTLVDAGYYWRVMLTDANSLTTGYVTANSGAVAFSIDNTAPDVNASTLIMLRTSGQTAVPSNGWTNNEDPYFSWSAGSDANGVLGSGIKGYCLYLGQDSNGNPDGDKGLLGTSPVDTTGTTCQFIVSTTSIDFTNDTLKGGTWLTSDSDPYYLNVKVIDNVGKVFAGASLQAQFRFENQAPTNVRFVNPASGSFSNVADMSFSWPVSGQYASSDNGPSGILGWQYQINTTDGDWLGSETSDELGVDYIPSTENSYVLRANPDANYIVAGNNTIYFRTIDQAGNPSDPSTYRTGVLQYGGAAPTFPGASSITVTPNDATSNSFSLSWPAATSGGSNTVTHYYYSINITPPSNLTTIKNNPSTFIDNGTSLTVAADSLPNVNRGENTVYVVATDDEEHYSPSNYITGTFSLNSSEPDNVGSLTASDSSIKSEERWMVTLTWTLPEYQGAGNLSYVVHRSTDDITYEEVGTTSSLSYVDSTEESTMYYYKVYTKDGVNQLSSGTTSVSMTPTGRWTSAPTLDSGPTASAIKTKSATITWSTSRKADSKISYGTSSKNYLPVEPSNSLLSTSHVINLSGLAPGTTYYYTAKWTDEDGNTGESEEKSFTTQPAPYVTDPTVSPISLDNATINFSVTGASKVVIYYGLTPSFGGIKELATSTGSSRYSVPLTGLSDGVKYYYKINTFDEDDAEYDGTALSFETLPRPKIENVRIQQVKNTAQPTILVSWTTNTEISSIITYYPVSSPADAKDEIQLEPTIDHKVIIRNLNPETAYELVVKGRDKQGNEGKSSPQKFTTATDTRPPVIADLRIQGSTQRLQNSQNQIAQLVISWNTDEAGTTQVEYGEGTGSSYPLKTQEDSALKSNHLVVISNLSPSKVYHVRAVSKDSAGNPGYSLDNVTITPKETDSALDLVLNNLQQIFGFLGNINSN